MRMIVTVVHVGNRRTCLKLMCLIVVSNVNMAIVIDFTAISVDFQQNVSGMVTGCRRKMKSCHICIR